MEGAEQDAVPATMLRLARSPHATTAQGSRVPLLPVDAALLVWLALEGPTPRHRLPQLLWPAADAALARNNLRQRLFRLRRQFGELVAADADRLSLAACIDHDLHDADTVLHECPVEATGEFAIWLGEQRTRRRERVRQSLLELCEMAERARDWPDAIAHAREMLALEPLSEEAHRRVMRLHYLAGDRAAAMLAFDHCERVLKDEVGVRPSSETLALLRTLEEAAAPAVQPVALRREPASVLRPPRLIGRADAWRAMEHALGSGGVVLLTGEGGLGKTRLATDFAQSHGAVVMTGARPGDERVPYASFSRLLRAVPRAAWQALGEAAQRELAWLLPELGEPAPRPDAQERTRLFNAAAALFGLAGSSGAPWLFDDLHVADDASVDVLQYIVGAGTLRWILCSRRSEASSAATRWIDELHEAAPTSEVRLAPLSESQVAELIESLAIEGLDARRHAPELRRRSGGNPLVLLEIVKAGIHQGDAGSLPAVQGLHRIVAGRISRLSPMAVRLARCAAVAAPDFSVELAARVLGVATIDLADAYAELEAAQVLVDDAFVHDLIYEAAIASVPAPVRRQLHAEIATFLAAHDGEPVRIARHWEGAGRWRAAGDAWLQAADRARGAPPSMQVASSLLDAALCFERAGHADGQFEALVRRASLLCDQMLGAEAQAAIDTAGALPLNPQQRLRLMAVQAENVNLTSDLEAAIRLTSEGIPAARAAGREDLELRFAGTAATALCDLRRAAEAVDLLDPYAEMARRQPDPEVQWAYWHNLGLSLDYAGRLRDAGPAWEAARAVAVGASRLDLAWQSLANAAATLSKTGLLRRALDQYEQAMQLAHEAHEPTPRLMAMQSTLGHRLRDIGRYAQALPLLESVLAEFDARGYAHECALAEHRLAQLFQQLGQPARSARLLATDRTGLPPGVAVMRAVHRADIAHDLGQDAEPLIRAALAMVTDPDDVYHRIAAMFATRILRPAEGEAMALSLAAWASARDRRGLALAAHVRAAACALALGAPLRAQTHVDAALNLAVEHSPDSFYLPELWLVAAQVSAGLADDVRAAHHVETGLDWIHRVAQVPAEYRDSFTGRNRVNQALAAMKAKRMR